MREVNQPRLLILSVLYSSGYENTGNQFPKSSISKLRVKRISIPIWPAPSPKPTSCQGINLISQVILCFVWYEVLADSDVLTLEMLHLTTLPPTRTQLLRFASFETVSSLLGVAAILCSILALDLKSAGDCQLRYHCPSP